MPMPMPNLLDMMNELGSRMRYGVGPTDKYRMMMSQSIPGQPEPFLPTGEENPDATRFMSNYLGTKQWGSGPSSLFNTMRYLIDDNTPAYASGLKGMRAAQSGGPDLQTLLASLAARR